MTENECRRIANLFYFPEYNGKCKPGWLLHHRDMTLKFEDPVRYHEWRIEDLTPMTVSSHTTLHRTGNHYTLSDKTRKLMSIARMGDKNPIRNLTKEQMAARGEKIAKKWKEWAAKNPDEVHRICRENAKKAYDGPKEKIDAMLEKRRQKMLGKRWVNDGNISLLINKDENPPEGWKIGRIYKRLNK